MIFSSHFLHAVTFLPVLHLNILRRQIETETEISLCMAIMLDHPWQSTVLPHCVIIYYFVQLSPLIDQSMQYQPCDANYKFIPQVYRSPPCSGEIVTEPETTDISILWARQTGQQKCAERAFCACAYPGTVHSGNQTGKRQYRYSVSCPL